MPPCGCVLNGIGGTATVGGDGGPRPHVGPCGEGRSGRADGATARQVAHVGERRGPRAEPRAGREFGGRPTGSKSVGVCGCSRRRLGPKFPPEYLLAAARSALAVATVATHAAHVGACGDRRALWPVRASSGPAAMWPNIAGVAQPRTASANFKRKRIEFAGCRRQPAAHPRGGMGGCARLKFNPKRERENASALALREVPRSRFALEVRLIRTPPRWAGCSPADRRDRAARHGAPAQGAPLRRPAPRPDARTARVCLPPVRAARRSSRARCR